MRKRILLQVYIVMQNEKKVELSLKLSIDRLILVEFLLVYLRIEEVYRVNFKSQLFFLGWLPAASTMIIR